MTKKYAYIIPVGQMPDEEKGYRAAVLMEGGEQKETDWHLGLNLSLAKDLIYNKNLSIFDGDSQAIDLFIIANLI